MLGLADRGRIRRLLEHVLSADASATLADLDEAHDLGIDPARCMRGLMEELHLATRAKAGASADALRRPSSARPPTRLASQLGWAQIHRIWQLLLKGLADVAGRARPARGGDDGAAAPDPRGRIARSGRCSVASFGRRRARLALSAGARRAQRPECAATSRLLRPYQFAREARQASARSAAARPGRCRSLRAARTRSEGRPVRLAPIGRATWLPRSRTPLVRRGRCRLSDEQSEPSLLDQEKMAEERVRSEVLADPAVQAAFEAFPDASLESFASTKGA